MLKHKLRQITLEDQKRPISAEDFAEIELAIRSMRCNPDPEGYDDFVVVAFKNEINGLRFIQTTATESYKTCLMEIGFARKGRTFPRLLRKSDLTVDDTVNIFRSVCCSSENPDFSEWKDVTEDVLEAIRQKEQKK